MAVGSTAIPQGTIKEHEIWRLLGSTVIVKDVGYKKDLLFCSVGLKKYQLKDKTKSNNSAYVLYSGVSQTNMNSCMFLSLRLLAMRIPFFLWSTPAFSSMRVFSDFVQSRLRRNIRNSKKRIAKLVVVGHWWPALVV